MNRPRCAITALCLSTLLPGCLFDDPHEPCSSLEGTTAPVPGSTPGSEPVPTGPLPDDVNGASGDRYRRADNGLICRCGDNEIGCYDSPDAALKASVCRPSPLGPDYEPNCQPIGTTPPDEQVIAGATWKCTTTGTCTIAGLVNRYERTEVWKDTSKSEARRKNEGYFRDGCFPGTPKIESTTCSEGDW